MPKDSKPTIGRFRGGENAKEIAHHKIVDNVVILIISEDQHERDDSGERQMGAPEIYGQAEKGADQERYHVVIELQTRGHEYCQQRRRHGKCTEQQVLPVSLRRQREPRHAQDRECN